MKPSTLHHLLLVVLTMTSGCVDAISFISLGQVFTAAMTGNTVLFGLSLAHANGASALGYAMALLGFMLGAAVASVIFAKARKTGEWTTLVTKSLLCELLALVAFAVIVNVLPAHTLKGMTSLLIIILGFAMGVQGVAARRVGVNAVTTTVITSTLTGLMEAVVWKAVDSSKARRAERESGVSHSLQVSNTTAAPMTSVVMWVAVIVFYGVGAGLCGLLLAHVKWQAIWLPIGFVLFVILTEAWMRRSLFSPAQQSTSLS